MRQRREPTPGMPGEAPETVAGRLLADPRLIRRLTGAGVSLSGGLVPIAVSDRAVVLPSGKGHVAKARIVGGLAEYRHFHRELLINRYLSGRNLPVVIPRLDRWDRRRRTLLFERLYGSPVAGKYPRALTPWELHVLLVAEQGLHTVSPGRRTLRAAPWSRMLRKLVLAGWLPSPWADAIAAGWKASQRRHSFAHGDFTPRNVLRLRDGRIAVIDWEYAGWYPRGYDLAFLWYCLGGCPLARARIEELPASRDPEFWISAAIIHARHLQMWRGQVSERAADFFWPGIAVVIEKVREARTCRYRMDGS